MHQNQFVENVLNCSLHISKKIAKGFFVVAKRWVVERTLAWFGNFRRLSNDFEVLTVTAENVIYIAMLKITVGKCI